MFRWLPVVVVLLGVTVVPVHAGQDSGRIVLAPYSYLEQRSAHSTHLLVRGPAPQTYKLEKPPAGVRRVVYPSDGRQLWGWLALPAGGDGAVPGIVYAHGGFAFAAGDFEDARPFLDAGFAVFTPTLRGENGNPGDFTLFYDEVDDLAAAVRWLAVQPGVREDRVYAFGHSTGGALTALLALFRDLPLRATASAGGLWFPESFANWRPDRICFPLDDTLETELRSMLPHMDELRRPHVAYLGDEERLAVHAQTITRQAETLGAPFWVLIVKGDHFDVLRLAIHHFITKILADL